mmetsp:Transcript_27271/g.55809  ORF Transcript_27271/g.55809 Transcript_27271/m.55809 type:complete len:242 (+) Transcript_27271:927-1652(+)
MVRRVTEWAEYQVLVAGESAEGLGLAERWKPVAGEAKGEVRSVEALQQERTTRIMMACGKQGEQELAVEAAAADYVYAKEEEGGGGGGDNVRQGNTEMRVLSKIERTDAKGSATSGGVEQVQETSVGLNSRHVEPSLLPLLPSSSTGNTPLVRRGFLLSNQPTVSKRGGGGGTRQTRKQQLQQKQTEASMSAHQSTEACVAKSRVAELLRELFPPATFFNARNRAWVLNPQHPPAGFPGLV